MTELPSKPRKVHTILWVLVAGLSVLFAVRLWVGDLYTVVSNSMEPFLNKGDRVWVQHGLGHPQRFDLLAFRNQAGQSVVKRLCGLPGEQVLIDQSGDLWIDNRRPERPDFWVPVFDDRLERVSEHFLHGGLQVDPWVERAGYWEVDASAVPQGYSQGLMRFRDGVDCGQLLPDGTYQHGSESVGDVRLRLEAFVAHPGGILRLELTEQADTFQIQLGLDNLEKGRVILTHLQGSSGTPVAASIAAI
ncbi:MAG TPA: signal peptidase I, partial [Planctomycetota bacterium]|nr:signal peptidase I [Planctomycetota bacterium]